MEKLPVKPWTRNMPYVAFGAYSWQINSTVTTTERDLYLAHALAAGKPLDEWINETLAKWANHDLNMGVQGVPLRKVSQLPKGQAFVLRFRTQVLAWEYYRQAAARQGFKQTSKWVRWTLNREVAI